MTELLWHLYCFCLWPFMHLFLYFYIKKKGTHLKQDLSFQKKKIHASDLGHQQSERCMLENDCSKLDISWNWLFLFKSVHLKKKKHKNLIWSIQSRHGQISGLPWRQISSDWWTFSRTYSIWYDIIWHSG